MKPPAGPADRPDSRRARRWTDPPSDLTRRQDAAYTSASASIGYTQETERRRIAAVMHQSPFKPLVQFSTRVRMYDGYHSSSRPRASSASRESTLDEQWRLVTISSGRSHLLVELDGMRDGRGTDEIADRALFHDRGARLRRGRPQGSVRAPPVRHQCSHGRSQ